MTDILVTDLTNGTLVNNEWVGTGIFDKLMDAVNKNIESQYLKGRISGTNYAEVYLAAIQSVVAQSVQYILQERVTEANVDNLQSQNLLSNIQMIEAKAKNRIALNQLNASNIELANKYNTDKMSTVSYTINTFDDLVNAEV